jgi:hypothetical protein
MGLISPIGSIAGADSKLFQAYRREAELERRLNAEAERRDKEVCFVSDSLDPAEYRV